MCGPDFSVFKIEFRPASVRCGLQNLFRPELGAARGTFVRFWVLKMVFWPGWIRSGFQIFRVSSLRLLWMAFEKWPVRTFLVPYERTNSVPVLRTRFLENSILFLSIEIAWEIRRHYKPLGYPKSFLRLSYRSCDFSSFYKNVFPENCICLWVWNQSVQSSRSINKCPPFCNFYKNRVATSLKPIKVIAEVEGSYIFVTTM